MLAKSDRRGFWAKETTGNTHLCGLKEASSRSERNLRWLVCVSMLCKEALGEGGSAGTPF